jgi:sulfur carrier protein
MKLEINGEWAIIPASGTVRELLENLGMNLDSVAVEWNGHVIRRQDWSRTAVREGDRLNIVRFGSGG